MLYLNGLKSGLTFYSSSFSMFTTLTSASGLWLGLIISILFEISSFYVYHRSILEPPKVSGGFSKF
jgi:hypothetical protein